MTTSRWLLLAAIVVVAGVNVLVWRNADGSPGIDCGPQGKPALNGQACIDRRPVTIP